MRTVVLAVPAESTVGQGVAASTAAEPGFAGADIPSQHAVAGAACPIAVVVLEVAVPAGGVAFELLSAARRACRSQ